MRKRHVLTLAFAVLIGAAPALAQLGPEDGANLPPTDLDRVKVGQPAPDFTLQNIDGTNVSLSGPDIPSPHRFHEVGLLSYAG